MNSSYFMPVFENQSHRNDGVYLFIFGGLFSPVISSFLLSMVSLIISDFWIWFWCSKEPFLSPLLDWSRDKGVPREVLYGYQYCVSTRKVLNVSCKKYQDLVLNVPKYWYFMWKFQPPSDQVNCYNKKIPVKLFSNLYMKSLEFFPATHTLPVCAMTFLTSDSIERYRWTTRLSECVQLQLISWGPF